MDGCSGDMQQSESRICPKVDEFPNAQKLGTCCKAFLERYGPAEMGSSPQEDIPSQASRSVGAGDQALVGYRLCVECFTGGLHGKAVSTCLT
eukprot:1239748-Amphidinium_carterae.1